MNTTAHNLAVYLAATHFMSQVPTDATAEDIFLALQADELPEGYLLWDRFSDRDEVADLIENLAEDFKGFSSMVYRREQVPFSLLNNK